MDEAVQMTLRDVERALASRTYDVTDEARVQAAIAGALDGAGLPHDREVAIDERSRIDFLVSAVGIEVKVDGASTAVLRQLARYVEHPRIRGLVLATTRARHAHALRAALPAISPRVPCTVVLLRGAL